MPVPRSGRSCQLINLARPAAKAPRYCLSFTAAGLRPELAAVIAGIHLEERGDWARTKAAVLDRNALQARSARTSKVLETELRQRLQCLTSPQLQLLARGTSDERSAMAWSGWSGSCMRNAAASGSATSRSPPGSRACKPAATPKSTW